MSVLFKCNVVFLLGLLLTGCGGGGGGSTAPTSTPTTTTPTTTPAPTSACGEMDTGDTCIGIQAGGGQHHFVYHEPQNRMAYAPIVIFMHGGGDSPITISSSVQAGKFADDMGFLAVMPVATPVDKQGWTWSSQIDDMTTRSTDTQLVLAIIDELVANNQADPDRVYVVGFSAGAVMGYQLACQLSDKIKGFVALSGSMRGNLSNCQPAYPVAIHHIHGSADSNIPVNGGPGVSAVPGVLNLWADMINGCDGTVSNSAEFSITNNANMAVTNTYNGCMETLKYTQVANGDHFQSYDISVLHQVMADLFQ